jgi:hypothetical protein
MQNYWYQNSMCISKNETMPKCNTTHLYYYHNETAPKEISSVRATNRCPSVPCLMQEDCQYGKCFQNDVEFNSKCLRKDEVLECVGAETVAVKDDS